MKKHVTLLVLLVLMIGLVFAAPALYINNSDFKLTKEQSAKLSFRVKNDASVEKVFNIGVTGDIAEFVSFDTGVYLEANEKKEVSSEIKVPKDIAYGVYEGRITLIPTTSDGEGIAISSGVAVPIKIEVLSKDKAFVPELEYEITEVGYPINTLIKLKNNTMLQIKSKILFELFKGEELVVANSVDKVVVPGLDDIVWELNTDDYEAGEYKLHVKIEDSTTVYFKKIVMLNLGEKGTVVPVGDIVAVKGPAVAGEKQKFEISTTFHNKSKFAVPVYLEAEIYDENDNLVKKVKSELYELQPDEEDELILGVRLDSKGDYKITTKAYYGNLSSEELEHNVKVQKDLASTQKVSSIPTKEPTQEEIVEVSSGKQPTKETYDFLNILILLLAIVLFVGVIYVVVYRSIGKKKDIIDEMDLRHEKDEEVDYPGQPKKPLTYPERQKREETIDKFEKQEEKKGLAAVAEHAEKEEDLDFLIDRTEAELELMDMIESAEKEKDIQAFIEQEEDRDHLMKIYKEFKKIDKKVKKEKAFKQIFENLKEA